MSSHGCTFSTPQALSDWLKPRLPADSLASWGVKPGTKNVHNLWLELSQGETSLLDSAPPIRTVNVVTVRVLGKDKLILIEAEQELSDGSFRDRFRPLSEKMKPHESVEEAAARAVKEELGSIAVTVVPGFSGLTSYQLFRLSPAEVGTGTQITPLVWTNKLCTVSLHEKILYSMPLDS